MKRRLRLELGAALLSELCGSGFITKTQTDIAIRKLGKKYIGEKETHAGKKS